MRTALPTVAPGRIRTTPESGSTPADRSAPDLPASETIGGVVAVSRADDDDAARVGEGGVSEAAPGVEGAPPDRRDERSAARAAASSKAAFFFAAFALLASSSPPSADVGVGEAPLAIDAAATDAACGSGAGDAASAAGEATCGAGESAAAADNAAAFGS